MRGIELQARTDATFGGGKARVSRLTLVADDVEFTLGDGPTVGGPAIALLLATCGRSVALEDLRGPGTDVLSGRA